jgi:hypothetical protein
MNFTGFLIRVVWQIFCLPASFITMPNRALKSYRSHVSCCHRNFIVSKAPGKSEWYVVILVLGIAISGSYLGSYIISICGFKVICEII